MEYVLSSEDRNQEQEAAESPRQLSFFKFLLRYPIFLLAFGPPVFRSTRAYAGVDTSQAHFDLWSICQVGWISLIALRAIYRLANRPVLIPREVQSILKLPFFLGLLYLVSVTYSLGRIVSAEYCILYFLSLACVLEFVVDAYQSPPNWMQCIFHLRTIAFLLFATALVTLFIRPDFVMVFIPGAGIRLLGGSVVAIGVICPLIAIISAYSFLHSLESRTRSISLFLLGAVGAAISQTRGTEIPLFFALMILGVGWATKNRRSAYIYISTVMVVILLASAGSTIIGTERIWSVFNRGEVTSGIQTFSGRTLIWAEAIRYCIAHPQGMGYIAGIRANRAVLAEVFGAAYSLKHAGGVDSSLFQVLTDAGWFALALYLLLLGKVVLLGVRMAKRHVSDMISANRMAGRAIWCALVLLFYFFINGWVNSAYATPMLQGFYFQNLVIEIILGASASLILASRPQRRPVQANDAGSDNSRRERN